jgi:hypothetical protein
LQSALAEKSVMSEELAQFPGAVVTRDGVRYRAHACGAPMRDGLWEGWIEFVPLDGGAPVRSPRETTQPNYTDAKYWATGLTPVYLEGALERALAPLVVKSSPPQPPLFNGPAPDIVSVSVPPASQPVLDPYSVYEKGELLLRQELGALARWHLVNIIAGYGLSDQPATQLQRLPAGELINLIVSSVRERATAR